MKQVRGIWLPDNDTHFEGQIASSPLVGGKPTYQLVKYRVAMEHVKQRRHAIDVGAHVGLWSRVMAIDFEHVTAFEPMAELRSCFSRNVDAGNVVLIGAAVGAVSGSIRIAMPADNSGNACVTDSGEKVPMSALDGLKVEALDFLKIDVEGYELEAIRGAEATVKRCRPVMVVEQKPNNAERYGFGRWDAVNLLKSWGMREAAVLSGDHVMVW